MYKYNQLNVYNIIFMYVLKDEFLILDKQLVYFHSWEKYFSSSNLSIP